MEINVNASKEWVSDLAFLLSEGSEVRPRGFLTREAIAYQSVVDMKRPIIVAPGRKLGYRFMAAEAAWILSGDDRVETIKPYSKDIANYSDDGETFFGAYGPKIRQQLDYVVDTLAKDQDSRQAIINIWRENPPATKDVPCTISAQWLIRDGMLHCLDTMRSSDIWLGHPYDMFNFSILSLGICLLLQERNVFVRPGALVLTAGSKHLYERNFEAARQVVEEYQKNPEAFNCPISIDPFRYMSYADLVETLWKLAAHPNGVLEESLW